MKNAVAIGVVALAAASVQATPVTFNFSLQATSGSQFGVTAPAVLSGTFNVDSSFLAQANGTYGGGAISLLSIQIGTQLFDQTTAFSPNIQGILLTNNTIAGLAMNWAQTPSGVFGPYMQMSTNGVWESGSTVSQAGENILRGGAGSQSFSIVPAPGAAAILGLGGLLIARRRR
jgi:hypothetical protein